MRTKAGSSRSRGHCWPSSCGNGRHRVKMRSTSWECSWPVSCHFVEPFWHRKWKRPSCLAAKGKVLRARKSSHALPISGQRERMRWQSHKRGCWTMLYENVWFKCYWPPRPAGKAVPTLTWKPWNVRRYSTWAELFILVNFRLSKWKELTSPSPSISQPGTTWTKSSTCKTFATTWKGQESGHQKIGGFELRNYAQSILFDWHLLRYSYFDNHCNPRSCMGEIRLRKGGYRIW